MTTRTVQGRCPLCGESHAACGQRTTTVPIDQRIEENKEAAMGELRTYVVEMGGQQRRLKLTEEDAKRLGASPVTDENTEGKARTTANKARTPRNKATSE